MGQADLSTTVTNDSHPAATALV